MSKVIIDITKQEVGTTVEERDFTENPINIETETTGTLPGNRDTKQTAKETPFSGEGFESTDVEGALNEVFTASDSNRKNIIAAIGSPLNTNATFQEITETLQVSKGEIVTALTYKNVLVNDDVSYREIADAILRISGSTSSGNASGENTERLVLSEVIDATANMPYELTIKPYLKPSETVAQVYKYIEENPAIVNYQDDFNNANAKSFAYNKEEIDFDGMMHIKDTYSYPFTRVADYYETQEIDFGAFLDYGGTLKTTETDITLYGIKVTESVAVANRDIPLDETLEINSVLLTAVGIVKVAVSRNSGFTWQTFDGTDFTDINIKDYGIFKEVGMSADALNNITKEQWGTYRDASNVIRFAYFIERPSYLTRSGTDVITMNSNMAARWIPAATTDYTYEFDTSAQAYNIVFLKSGKYRIRYLDGDA